MNPRNDQTRIITGNFTLRGITKPVMFKANISKEGNRYRFTGELEVNIDDHKIKVPGVLSANIAKKIQVSFNFQFEPDEKKNPTFCIFYSWNHDFFVGPRGPFQIGK